MWLFFVALGVLSLAYTRFHANCAVKFYQRVGADLDVASATILVRIMGYVFLIAGLIGGIKKYM